MKQKLARHWEKIALGVSVLLVGYGLVGVMMKAPDPLFAQVDKRIGDVSDALKNTKSAEINVPPYRTRVASAFGALAEARAGNEWTAYKPTVVTIKENVVQPSTPTRQIVFKAPTLVSAEADVGIVKLEWKDDPDNTVKPGGYRVYRKKAGDKEETRVEEVAAAEKSYLDAQVTPKTEYQFSVAAVPDETDKEAVEKLRLTKGEGPRSNAITVRTKGVLGITLTQASALPSNVPGDPPEPLGNVKVRKFVDGNWETRAYMVRRGDTIGKKELISRNGRAIEIDFSTKYVVVDIFKGKVTITDTIMQPVFNEKGEKIGEKKITVTREVEKWKLSYKDDEGALKEISLEGDAGGPRPSAPGEKKPEGPKKPDVPKKPAPAKAAEPAKK